MSMIRTAVCIEKSLEISAVFRVLFAIRQTFLSMKLPSLWPTSIKVSSSDWM